MSHCIQYKRVTSLKHIPHTYIIIKAKSRHGSHLLNTDFTLKIGVMQNLKYEIQVIKFTLYAVIHTMGWSFSLADKIRL